jgi:vacuolar-type H+-ATPase subunit I/STV1
VSGIAFAEVLRVNTALQRLYVERNTLTDESAVRFATALEANSTLAVLSLADNELHDGTADALLKAMQVNTTLSHLDIGCNDFGCQAYVHLMKMIEQKQRLLAANIEEIAQRHINWLKEEEVRLFQLRSEIRQRTAEVASAREVSAASTETLKEMVTEKKAQADAARATLEELDKNLAATENLRRQSAALNEFQGYFSKRQAALGALGKKNAMLEQTKAQIKRGLSEVEQRRDDTRDQLRAIIGDVMRAKALIREEEQMEALQAQQ